MQNDRSRTFAWGAAATILVSAFLLFQVQPIISKMILPWFGGSSAVWTTCMLFFQIVLLAGYGYAHALTRCCAPRRQVLIHATLLLAALVTLPITPADSWRPSDGDWPSLRILTVLALNVGLPYFLLSTTGPLVQAWFGNVCVGRSPYRLYALSNIGSLAALLSYPFVFEPALTLSQQDGSWSIGFVLFVLLNVWLAWHLWRFTAATVDEAKLEPKPEPLPALEQKLLWIALPALASVALLAVTNHLSQDVAAVPFLWVIPLSLYLLSFILCFDSDRWYQRWLFPPAAMLSILWICLLEAAPTLDKHCQQMNWSFTISEIIDSGMTTLIDWGNRFVYGFASLKLEFSLEEFDYNPVFQGLFYLSSLFFGCMVCHGELSRLKPGQQYLTEYYLLIAAGGALGGVFVALVCPVIFVWYAELPLAQAGIFLVSGVSLALLVFGKLSGDRPGNKWLRFALCATALAGVGMLSTDATLKDQAEWLRGLATLVIAFVGVALAYGVVATSRRELQIICSAVAGLLMLSGLFGLVLGSFMRGQDATIVAAERSFYGALQVKIDGTVEEPAGRWLTHGRIQHGYQHHGPAVAYDDRRSLPADLQLRYQPTTYYAEGSGVGLAIRRHPNQGRQKIGVVGLGAGTIAAFGRPGDEIRFYEIDAAVQRLSEAHFTFRRDTPAKADEVVLGDARLKMEQESPQRYDVIAVDAFSGDAIPTHLLTRECLAVYQKHLKPEGILAIHISNRYLDLAPVVRALAQRGKLRAENFHYKELPDELRDTSSEWILLTRSEAFFDDPLVQAAITPQSDTRVIEWTDEYSNLRDILQ